MDIRNREAVLPYVEQFLAGDLEAFSFIYKIYKDSVYYFAVSITKNTADAEEVVQETFLKVYHKVSQLEDLNKFHSWIFSITYNTALNMNRRKSYTLVSYEDTVAMGEEDKQLEGASENYDKKELVEIIGERFTQLPPDLFAVAKLRYFEELKIREIADILEVSDTIIKRRLRKVKDYMVPELQKHGITPEKYFSFGSIPIIAKGLEYLYTQNTMQGEFNRELLAQSVVEETVPKTPKSTRFIKLVAVGAVGMVAVGAVGITQSTPSTLSIEKLSYSEEPTNQSVLVSVEMNRSPRNDSIDVYYENEPIYFEVDGATLTFNANDNGSYKVQTSDSEQEFTIDNIDKVAPELVNADYDGNTLTLDISDNHNDIDYQKSYIDYQGEKLKFDESMSVVYDFEGEVKIVLYDGLGNESIYQLDINKLWKESAV